MQFYGLERSLVVRWKVCQMEPCGGERPGDWWWAGVQVLKVLTSEGERSTGLEGGLWSILTYGSDPAYYKNEPFTSHKFKSWENTWDDLPPFLAKSFESAKNFIFTCPPSFCLLFLLISISNSQFMSFFCYNSSIFIPYSAIFYLIGLSLMAYSRTFP